MNMKICGMLFGALLLPAMTACGGGDANEGSPYKDVPPPATTEENMTTEELNEAMQRQFTREVMPAITDLSKTLIQLVDSAAQDARQNLPELEKRSVNAGFNAARGFISSGQLSLDQLNDLQLAIDEAKTKL